MVSRDSKIYHYTTEKLTRWQCFFNGRIIPNKSEYFIPLKQKSCKSNSVVHKAVLLIDLQYALQPNTTSRYQSKMLGKPLTVDKLPND